MNPEKTLNEKIEDIILDPVEFIKRLTIKDKNGKLTQFGNIITPEQIEIIKAIHSNQRVAILKARQMGITTICRAFAFWEIYTSKRTLTSALVSNKFNSAVELLKIDKRFHETLPPFLQRKIKVEKRDEIVFASNKSAIKSFSGQATNLRSFTFASVHISEFDFIPEADDVLANLLASVNEGKLILETTPNYYGSPFHQIINDSVYSNAYKVIFLPWSAFPLYRKELPLGGITLEKEEELLVEANKLDLEQIFWRREKIAEMKDEAKFNREFPLTIEDAYSLSGKNYFSRDELKNIKPISVSNQELTIIKNPDWSNDDYVIGVDPAGGVGFDYSVAYVMSRETLAPVAILSSNKLSIRDFTEKVIKLSNDYKNAITIVEQNNHGHTVREVMNQFGFYRYEMFTTTVKSKLALYDLLRTYIVDNLINEIDSLTYKELRELVKNDKGTAPEHPPGSHDDRIIAMMLALQKVKDLPRRKKTQWELIEGELRGPVKETALPKPIRS